jgi:hypothetical protein
LSVPKGVRLTSEQKAAVLADLRATSGTPEGSYRKVAKRHGITEASIRRIVVASDHDVPAEARARTQNAIERRALSNADRRKELAERLLAEAQAALDDMQNGSIVHASSFGEITFKQAPRVLPRDRQALMTTAAIALDKHRMLDQYDSAAAGAAAVDLWLQGMVGG